MSINILSTKISYHGIRNNGLKTYTCLYVCRQVKLLSQVIRKDPRKIGPVNLSYISYEKSDMTHHPPVFIFHGVLGNKTQWETIGKTILNVTHRKVVSVDLRNHGESPHVQSHRYSELAADVLLLLEKLGAPQASLIGHSMGGRTAMCVALMAPKRVTGLQVVDISPKTTPLHFRDYLPQLLQAIKSIQFGDAKKVSVARNEVRKQLHQLVSDDYVMRDILWNIKLKSDGTIGWACNLDILIKHYKYWVSFPKVSKAMMYNGPTLFVGGQLSDFIPPDELNEIRTLFPRAVVTYIPKAGHYVQDEDPRSFLELTISFLKKHRYSRHVQIK